MRILGIYQCHGGEILGTREAVGVEHQETGVLERSTSDLDLTIMPHPAREDEDHFIDVIRVTVDENAQGTARTMRLARPVTELLEVLGNVDVESTSDWRAEASCRWRMGCGGRAAEAFALLTLPGYGVLHGREYLDPPCLLDGGIGKVALGRPLISGREFARVILFLTQFEPSY